MKNQLARLSSTVILGSSFVLAVSLSGCSSTPSGPSKTDVLKGLAQMDAANEGDWKGDYRHEKDFMLKLKPYMRGLKCAKAGVESWTCDYRFVNDKGRSTGQEQVKLRKSGHHWNYVPGSFRDLASSVSRSDD